ncbi:MAG: S-layer homology domain-containing protein [Clostridia bacterium]|nr:S-layer homology domain-containing protein [Clostridia bacterium]
MRKISRPLIFIIITVLCLSFGTAAFASELPEGVTIVSYTENYENINRFINLGESIDISQGSITFMLSNRTPAKKSLTNEMLTELPDTSVPGYFRACFNVYDIDFEINFMVLDPEKSAEKFVDIDKKTYWGYTHVDNCVMAGIFSGRSEAEFAKFENMTRAEFCQMMYNIYKNDKVLEKQTDSVFTDTPETAWYYTAVKTCADAGIIVGMGDGRFEPDGNITRQDAAIIMMNIIYGREYIAELDFEQTVKLAREKGIAATDIEDCSDYAKNAVAAALGVIYYGDTSGVLYPKLNILRGECAAMMSAYYFEGYTRPEPEKPDYLVYLSPSNQIHNSYANYSKNNATLKQYTEGIQMQIVAEYAKKELEKMGYRVYVADVSTSINDDNPYGAEPKEDGKTSRAEEAAALGADCYVAIHSNAIGSKNDGSVQGTMSFYNGTSEESTALAKAVHNKVAALTPTKEKKGAFQDDIAYSLAHGQQPYAEVWRPQMANVLLEVEYHDYKPYADWIVNNTENIGIAIAQGIDEYFNNKK